MSLVTSAYFSFMIFSGNINISTKTQDWGNFGSYVGGVLAPVFSFFASYLIYQNLRFDSYHKRLEIIRESISRLDDLTNSKLNSEVKNNKYGQNMLGKPFIEIIIALDSQNIQYDKDLERSIIAIFHNIAIMAKSIEYYLILLSKLENEKLHSEWLVNTESYYWITKYSSICGRMVRIVGKSKILERLDQSEVKAMKHIAPELFN